MIDLTDLPLFRVTDPETSRAGAKDIKPRQGSQIMLLLATYRNHSLFGLTDEEAGKQTAWKGSTMFDTRVCYWKRCSDLRNLGLIEPTGDTRLSTAGSAQQVCRITSAGLEALK